MPRLSFSAEGDKSASTLGRCNWTAALDTGRVSTRGSEVEVDRNNVFPEQFSVTREVEDGGVRIRVFGELDLATVPLFESRFDGAADGAIVLDLGELTFIDAAGLRAVLSAEAQAREKHQSLILMDGSLPVRKLFELTGNQHLLDGATGSGADHD